MPINRSLPVESRSGRRRIHRPTRAFTLVELLVTIVIIMMLSSLALAGMAAARKRVKIDRTRSTIMKIHEIVMPHYDSYVRRRLPANGDAGFLQTPNATLNALNRLVAIRQLMVYEMPDSWNDVRDNVAAVALNLPVAMRTGPVLGYAATKSVLLARGISPAASNDGPECLYMIASRGCGDPESMEQFRSDEVGDTDKDGVPEFLDGWGQPIGFIRWAGGFSSLSAVQKADSTNYHDPSDPMRVDAGGYALIPLIVSAGPDGVAGLVLSSGWQPATINQLRSVVNGFGAPSGDGAADNVTNHDLMKK